MTNKISILALVRQHIFSSDWRYLFVHEDGRVFDDNPYDTADANVIGWWKLEDGNVLYDLGQ